MINKAILIGRVGKDPETRFMTSGDAVTNLSLATSEYWKDKNGEKQERTDWHNLVFYKKLAEIAGEYLRKGALIWVEGKIQTRKWQDKDGQDRYTTEIIVRELKMLGGKQESESKPQDSHNAAKSNAYQGNPAFDGMEDDIPF